MTGKPKLLALAAVVVLGLAACGTAEDDNGQGNAPEGGGSEGGGAATQLSVTAENFAFEVDGILPEAGGEVDVTLTNGDDAPHTFSSEEVDLDVEADPGGEGTGSFTVPDDGSVDFQCNIHTNMKITLTAGEEASDAGGGGSGSGETSDDDDYDY